MFKEFIEILAGIKMTIFSGLCLLCSFICMVYHFNTPLDTAWLTIFISGSPIAYSAIRKLFSSTPISSSLLITIATLAAIAIGEVFAAGEVVFIMAIGEILEDITVDRAQRGLSRLLELKPTTGRKINADNTEEVLPIEKIKSKDILRVLPGETVPVDGIIVKGNSSLNQAALTGESLPVDKGIGDMVMAGTINCFGVIDIRVTAIQNTYLQKMINLVKEADAQKAPTQRIVDKWAAILVPVALFLAILTYIFTHEVIRAVTILVVFCPCALVLATPTAIVAAIGQASKYGILIKSGAALEEMGKVDTMAFDKTGTLTAGNIKVCDIISFAKDFSKTKLLSLIAGLEKYSEHTLAQAVVRYAVSKKITPYEITQFSMQAGKGVSGVFENKVLFAGNMKFIQEQGILIPSLIQKKIFTLQDEGKAIIIVCYNHKIIGVIALADELRSNAASVIKDLKNVNISPIILSGDHYKTAKRIARCIGIKKIVADLLPDGKVKQIGILQNNQHIVCMVGDGINDAAALKAANIGIAMGKIGSDITIDAADITLINDNIESLPYLKKLANMTIKFIKINITLSMLINLIGVLLSVYGILTPVTGAIVHNLGSIIVILNAAGLYNRQL